MIASGAISHPSIGAGEFRSVNVFSSIFLSLIGISRQPKGWSRLATLGPLLTVTPALLRYIPAVSVLAVNF